MYEVGAEVAKHSVPIKDANNYCAFIYEEEEVILVRALLEPFFRYVIYFACEGLFGDIFEVYFCFLILGESVPPWC